MNELVAKINEAFEAFSKDAALQVEKGNKAAGTRARKASLELENLILLTATQHTLRHTLAMIHTELIRTIRKFACYTKLIRQKRTSELMVKDLFVEVVNIGPIPES